MCVPRVEPLLTARALMGARDSFLTLEHVRKPVFTLRSRRFESPCCFIIAGIISLSIIFVTVSMKLPMPGVTLPAFLSASSEARVCSMFARSGRTPPLELLAFSALSSSSRRGATSFRATRSRLSSRLKSEERRRGCEESATAPEPQRPAPNTKTIIIIFSCIESAMEGFPEREKAEPILRFASDLDAPATKTWSLEPRKA
mmetsp:Transcript_65407/g.168342  ORF Transcript_65407/g.168342 Transcript_65407/m.168342 type:complete len:201 (+) Transcript_65407:893-1495(+)